MKKLIISGIDSYIDNLKNSLQKDYTQIKKNMKIKKIRENLLIDNNSYLEEL